MKQKIKVKMKITKNGKTIFDDVKRFDTAWEASMWCTRSTTDSFGDDLNKVRVRRTKETVMFDSELDVAEQYQRSDYTTSEGMEYIVIIGYFDEESN